MPEYVPVPVEAARAVAQRWEKQVVVIVAWDQGHNKVHTTTYGFSPRDKIAAAKLGELLTAAAGADRSESVGFEDFRWLSQAEAAQAKERLETLIAECEAVAVGLSPDLRNHDLESRLRTAAANARGDP
jgi:hypothetical protein